MRRNAEPCPTLCFEIREGTALQGLIRFWVMAQPGDGQFVLLGPLAVEPALRGLGLGRALVQHGCAAARAQGVKGLFVIGDETYYRNFGFCPEAVQGMTLEGPVAPLVFMGLYCNGGQPRAGAVQFTGSA